MPQRCNLQQRSSTAALRAITTQQRHNVANCSNVATLRAARTLQAATARRSVASYKNVAMSCNRAATSSTSVAAPSLCNAATPLLRCNSKAIVTLRTAAPPSQQQQSTLVRPTSVGRPSDFHRTTSCYPTSCHPMPYALTSYHSIVLFFSSDICLTSVQPSSNFRWTFI